MFKREINVSLSKPNAATQTGAPVERGPFLNEDDINLGLDIMKKAAISVGSVLIALKLVDAACEITVAHAKPKQ